jgi:hypothetical protein
MGAAPCKCINGVVRYDTPLDDSESLYEFSKKPNFIVVPRRLLDRELRRIIQEAIEIGGEPNELSLDCMLAIDADTKALAASCL